ncbi:Na+/H+-dicarboxylate symporter [Arcanobacterium wilhelmae]|uniref:Na+/H+-dicarboxylate symporter n=1 Tax=Arcanobacterium wilhelmae TaxID=1803177 RepID=A0ABT9NA67_9ACTO|nr:dicarboxylate/amino acid:cation symporter [Arcanobacterium wilhelmae]MDP9800603.1 Na+/H+-dicarboxylate symporter [Arcanobacterium wilhelmae]WFN90011.1 dicarboxylate/amino acid:cation symporter [Arcanobacterium wilhelmae]
MSALKRAGVLPWVIGAIVAGIICGQFFPTSLTRGFVTFNDLFSQFLGFAVPLIIVGLIVPAIADLGKGAGKWLGITAAIAYGSSLFAGFLTFFAARAVYPMILHAGQAVDVQDPSKAALTGYIKDLTVPPVFGVMTALVLSFVVGIGLSLAPRGVIRKGFVEFREIITGLISKVIIPFLPLHIFGIFLNLTQGGEIAKIIATLVKIVVFVLVLEVIILGAQYGIAGAIARKNPLKALGNMMPAYFTALGTSSSAATIPVTLRQTLKNGVSEPVASFVVPLCATIHLAGSMSKITAFAMAIITLNGLPVTTAQMVGFIFMLGVIMVAAPGVPGGAIMASVGILGSMLSFNDAAVGLMIASYIALDSFGTATNVTGDGAIALVIDHYAEGNVGEVSENARDYASRNTFDGEAYLRSVS